MGSDVVTLGRGALRALGARVGCFYVAQTMLAVLVGGSGSRPIASAAVAVGGLALIALALAAYAPAFPDVPDAVVTGRMWAVRIGGFLLPTCLLTGVVSHFALTQGWSAAGILAANVAAGAGAGLVLSAGLGWGWITCLSALATDCAVRSWLAESVDYVGLTGGVVTTGVASVGALFVGRGFAAAEAALAGADLALAAQQVSSQRWTARQNFDRALHDTVLSTLSVLAQPELSAPQLQVRQECRRDVQMLESVEKSATVELVIHPPRGDDDLDHIVARWVSQGLVVHVHGIPWSKAASRLSASTERALLEALHECLRNVVRHAATDVADIVVMDRPTAVAVQVVDGGRGFDTTAVGEDRLGLESSVRARIADAGGKVVVWSRPGSGTSVLLTVPAEGLR